MSRSTNRLIWVVAAAAVVLFALWQQRTEAPVATVEAPSASDPSRLPAAVTPSTASATRSEPEARSKIDDLVPDARERASLLETLALIERGGPFPHSKDGMVFQNRERQLPERRRGYYREYTVPTPGAGDRGARRIVRGREGETYYTRDHYRSFVRLDG